MEKIRIIRYVPHDKIEDYESMGWEVISDFGNSHHAKYAVVMENMNVTANDDVCPEERMGSTG